MNAQESNQNNEQASQKLELPSAFLEYVRKKIEMNGSGGRPSLSPTWSRDGKTIDEKMSLAMDKLLNVLEASWIKKSSCSKIARDCEVSNDTMWRLLKEVMPFKELVSP